MFFERCVKTIPPHDAKAFPQLVLRIRKTREFHTQEPLWHASC